MSTVADDPLAALRAEIDAIDAELIALLARRFQVTAQVGQVKKAHALPAIDAGREARQAEAYRLLAERHGLAPAFVDRCFRLIIDEVVANHRRA